MLSSIIVIEYEPEVTTTIATEQTIETEGTTLGPSTPGNYIGHIVILLYIS